MKNIFTILLSTTFALLLCLLVYKIVSQPKSTSYVVSSKQSTEHLNSPELNKETVEKIIVEYLEKNPEIIIKSLENFQNQQVEKTLKKTSDYIKDNRDFIENQKYIPIIGNPSGKNVVVVFFDYHCKYCKLGNDVLKSMLAKNTDLKIVLRPMPILGEDSAYTTKVAFAVSHIMPAKFVEFHNALFALKVITPTRIKEILNDMEISYSEVENEINSFSLGKLISSNLDVARNLAIKGAPSYIVNGYFHQGYMDEESFVKLLKETMEKNNDKTNAK